MNSVSELIWKIEEENDINRAVPVPVNPGCCCCCSNVCNCNKY